MFINRAWMARGCVTHHRGVKVWQTLSPSDLSPTLAGGCWSRRISPSNVYYPTTALLAFAIDKQSTLFWTNNLANGPILGRYFTGLSWVGGGDEGCAVIGVAQACCRLPHQIIGVVGSPRYLFSYCSRRSSWRSCPRPLSRRTQARPHVQATMRRSRDVTPSSAAHSPPPRPNRHPHRHPRQLALPAPRVRPVP